MSNPPRARFTQSPLSGRFSVSFNGIERKIILRRDKGEYQIDRVRNKIYSKFQTLATQEFVIKMSDGSLIDTDLHIISFLLGQQEPLPKCNVILNEREESMSKSPEIEQDVYHEKELLMHENGLHNDSPISPLVPISFDLCPPNLNNHVSDKSNQSNKSCKSSKSNKSNKSNRSNKSSHQRNRFKDKTHDMYQEHGEYICCFNNILAKLNLRMLDVARYSDELFKDRFLSLFDCQLKSNESLQLRIYQTSTKQYIPVELPLWSYGSQHYHIEGEIIINDNLQIDKNEMQNINYGRQSIHSQLECSEGEKQEEEEEEDADDDDEENDDDDDREEEEDVDENDDDDDEDVEEESDDDHEHHPDDEDMDDDVDVDVENVEDDEEDEEDDDIEEENWSTSSINNFQDILIGLESDLKSQQRELQTSITNIDEQINSNNNGKATSIDLWRKHNVEVGEIERDINEFCNDCHLRLSRDLTEHLNTKCERLKEFCCRKLNKMNELQHAINCDENEIIHLEKAIRQLTIQKMEYHQNVKAKQMHMKKEENIWNSSQKQLKKLQRFQSKYESTKQKLTKDIITFEQNEKLKIYDMQRHLNHIWNRFELFYQSWNSSEALQWICCIQNFYFSDNKFNPFIETLKTHQFIGRNLKELRAPFTLKCLGLQHPEDQQVLIKNINRIITKARRKSSKSRQHQQQIQQIQQMQQGMYSSAESRHRSSVYNKRKSKRNGKMIQLPQIPSLPCSSASSPTQTETSTAASQGTLCCICAENEINTCIIPCGHMVYCSECSKKLTITTCPTCRGKDVKIVTTYKSGL